MEETENKNNLVLNNNIQESNVCKKGMDRRSFLKTAAVVSAAITAGSGISIKKAWAKKVKTLIIGTGATPGGFDTSLQASANEAPAYTNMNDNILTYKIVPYPQETLAKKGVLWGDSNFVEPHLVESWSISPDKKRLTFKFRERVKGHQGNELTSADMKYSIERAFALKGLVVWFLTAMNITSSEQVRIIDKYTFEINTPSPTPLTLQTLTNEWFPVEDHLVGKRHATSEDTWATKYMARNSHAWGPYTCKEFKSGEQCTFEALDNYWRQPKVGKVILKAIPESGNRVALLERGKIDIADLLLPKEIDYLQGRKGVKVFNVPNNLVFYLNMNSLKKPFDDIRVRQAMNYACPKEEILSSAFRGLAQPMKSCISQIFPDYTDRFWKYDYNPDKAARLLADAGYPQGFEIELTFSDYNAVDEEVAVIMRNALKKIKVDCKLRKLPAAAFMEKLFKKEHAFCVETECPIIPDPGYWATVFFEGNAFLNHSNIHDPELDKLIDSVRGTYDTKERLEFSKKIQERVLELAHKVFICCPGVQVAMRDDIGGNLHMGWVNSYHWEKLDKI